MTVATTGLEELTLIVADQIQINASLEDSL